MRLRHLMASSAFAIVPFLLSEGRVVLNHSGDFIHFSKGEALGLVGLLALMQMLACFLILFIASFLTRRLQRGEPGFLFFAFLLLAAAFILLNPPSSNPYSAKGGVELMVAGLIAIGFGWWFRRREVLR